VHLALQGRIASVRARVGVLVVVTVVAMVALPPLIDSDDLVLGNRLGERPVPLATALEVQALEKGATQPMDQEEGENNPESDAEAQE
jgi:hypothetical protein